MANELGISATGYGAGSSRPVIIGSIAVHVDTAINNATNYSISGNSTQSQGQPDSGWTIPPNGSNVTNYTGKLPNAFTNPNNFGFGASYIVNPGYTGVSV